MAHLQGNDIYLAFDGQDVSAEWMSGTWGEGVTDQTLTAGTGSTHEEHGPGLRSFNFNFTLEYDTTTLSNYLTDIRTGAHAMIVGPEGSSSGQPKDNRNVLITSINIEGQGVEKTPVNVSISGVGNGTPTTDFFAGGTWS